MKDESPHLDRRRLRPKGCRPATTRATVSRLMGCDRQSKDACLNHVFFTLILPKRYHVIFIKHHLRLGVYFRFERPTFLTTTAPLFITSTLTASGTVLDIIVSLLFFLCFRNKVRTLQKDEKMVSYFWTLFVPDRKVVF